MKKATLMAFLLALTLALAGPAVAVVVDFDAINTGGTLTSIPSGYAGFTWDGNFWAIDNTDYNFSYQNTVTFPSSPNAAFNAFGVFEVSASKAPFTLNGAYFSSFTASDTIVGFSATGLTVTGYSGGNPVGSVHFLLTNNFVYQPLGLANIDSVVFTTDEGIQGYYWLMDNMTYNAAPIPGAVWLLSSGLVGLLGWRRFSQN